MSEVFYRVAVVSSTPLVRHGLARLPERVVLVDDLSCGGSVVEPDVTLYDLNGLVQDAGVDLLRLLTKRARVVGVVAPGHPDLGAHALSMGVVQVVPLSVTRSQLVFTPSTPRRATCQLRSHRGRTGWSCNGP